MNLYDKPSFIKHRYRIYTFWEKRTGDVKLSKNYTVLGI